MPVFFDKTQDLLKAYRHIVKTYTQADSIRTPGKLHEKIGLVLIHQLYTKGNGIDKKYKDIPGFSAFFDISFAVTVTLIALEQYEHYTREPFISGLAEIADFGYLYPLANIISGPVDCDRLDYLLRDATNSGTPDMISFDQERIINNVKLTRLEKGKVVGKSETGKELVLAKEMYVPSFDRRSFSALADFFYTRYRQFRWLIGHHNVVRTDHSMARLILELATISGGFIHEVDLLPEKRVEKDIKSIVIKRKFNKLLDLSEPSINLRYIDDPWLDNCLQDILFDLQQKPTQALSNQARRIKKYLELIVERKIDHMPAIWKNEDRFRSFAKVFNKYLLTQESRVVSAFSPDLKAIFLDAIKQANEHLNPSRATNLVLKYWWGLEVNLASSP